MTRSKRTSANVIPTAIIPSPHHVGQFRDRDKDSDGHHGCTAEDIGQRSARQRPECLPLQYAGDDEWPSLIAFPDEHLMGIDRRRCPVRDRGPEITRQPASSVLRGEPKCSEERLIVELWCRGGPSFENTREE